MFDTKKYWNNRLKKDYSLNSVGDITLGAYNNYLYKVRKFIFKKIINNLNLSVNNAIIADIGSGTGFYIDLWQNQTVRKIIGIDISTHAVKMLKERFTESKFEFIEADISTKPVKIENIDVITAFDIFYHIVDDDKYLSALININKMLKLNGVFIFSDNLLRGKKINKEHQVCRNEQLVRQSLNNAGFEIINIYPMFILMNQSFYPKNLFSKYTFPYATKFIRKNNLFAHLTGLILYPIEILLVSICKRSYSTEIIVCKKIKNENR